MIMGPFDRDLNRLQLELPGEEQKFRIEAPSFYSLASKDDLDSVPGKRLEPALGIAISQSEHNAQPKVEQPPVQLAKNGLALGLQFAFEPAGPNGDISSVGQCCK